MPLDETQKSQQGDKTPEGQQGTTPEETPTLTRKEAEALAEARASKARSDALAEVGRLRKAAEDASKVAQQAVARLQKQEEDRLRAEEEDAKDDPAKLSAIQLRRQAMQTKAEAEERIRKAEEKETENQTQYQEILEHRAERLAEKYNVDSAILLKYGGGKKESMEELAKSFGERKASAGEPEQSKGRMTSPPDSGKTKGGGTSKTPTLEELKSSLPEETEKKVKSGEWIVPGWSV